MIEAVVALFFVIACLFAFLWSRSEKENRSLLLEKNSLQIHLNQALVRLEEEKSAALHAREAMKDSFKALSGDVLRAQQTAFFDVAKTTFEKYSTDWTQKQQAISEVVKPLRESLDKVDGKIQELEKARISNHATVSETLRNLHAAQNQLHVETSKLSRALRSSNVRGQWGEMQLKRVVELAGMVEYCDFLTQETVTHHEGRHRPDLIVKLPNDRVVVIDAKAPLQAYLEAIDAPTEEIRLQKYKEHAKQVKKHLLELSEKAYWENFSQTPEFVILFLPGESIFGAALEADPQLIEFGAGKKVLLATPTTLIALLRAVSQGWREQMLHESALQISQLGKALHERLATMVEHFGRLKRALDSSVDAYNKVAASFESRVLPSARKFDELGVASAHDIALLEPIEKQTRALEPVLE